jgi:hypothetical protein
MKDLEERTKRVEEIRKLPTDAERIAAYNSLCMVEWLELMANCPFKVPMPEPLRRR